MKLWTKILSIFLFFSLIFLPKNINARSGCCSHHDGVCGCRCCDGSPLSSTCAPYYPSCSSGAIQTTQPIQPTKVPTKTPTAIPTKIPPTNTPIPTSTSTLIPTKILTISPTIKPTQTEEISPTAIPQPQILSETTTKPTEPPKTSDYIITFSILGLFGFGIYKFFIKIKNKIRKIFKKD